MVLLTDLSRNRFGTKIKLKSSHDVIYKAIDDLKGGMILLNTELDVKKDSESERDWVNIGLAKFSNILRENNSDLNDLFEIILQELIKYIGAVLLQVVIPTVTLVDNGSGYRIVLKIFHHFFNSLLHSGYVIGR